LLNFSHVKVLTKEELTDKSNEPFLCALDCDAEIDFEVVKEEIYQKGPLLISMGDSGGAFSINISPCQMSSEKNSCCEIITVMVISGFTSLTTSVEKEDLLSSKSLVHFSQRFLSRPLEFFCPSGEQQFIESEIKRVFAFNPMDVYRQEISIEEIRKSIVAANIEDKSDVWSAVLLEQVFKLLLEHRYVRSEAIEADLEDDGGEQRERIDEEISGQETETDEFIFEEYFDSVYRLGFLTGRLISEYFVRNEIESLARLGNKSIEDQEKRVKQSGKVSSDKKHQRINALLGQLETLFKDNPALSRLHIENVAQIALQDAIESKPRLWSQGKGQLKEYLEEMRVDIKYAKRFKALTAKTA